MITKIVKMEDIRDDFVNHEPGLSPEEDMLDIGLFMQYTIDLFKNIIDKQEQTYYPNEEEISNIKIGGTD